MATKNRCDVCGTTGQESFIFDKEVRHTDGKSRGLTVCTKCGTWIDDVTQARQERGGGFDS